MLQTETLILLCREVRGRQQHWGVQPVGFSRLRWMKNCLGSHRSGQLWPVGFESTNTFAWYDTEAWMMVSCMTSWVSHTLEPHNPLRKHKTTVFLGKFPKLRCTTHSWLSWATCTGMASAKRLFTDGGQPTAVVKAGLGEQGPGLVSRWFQGSLFVASFLSFFFF